MIPSPVLESMRYRTDRLTPLNQAVNLLYAACAGKHVRSDQWINREWKAIWTSFNVCAACGVPQKVGVVKSVWLSGEEAA